MHLATLGSVLKGAVELGNTLLPGRNALLSLCTSFGESFRKRLEALARDDLLEPFAYEFTTWFG